MLEKNWIRVSQSVSPPTTEPFAVAVYASLFYSYFYVSLFFVCMLFSAAVAAGSSRIPPQANAPVQEFETDGQQPAAVAFGGD